MNKIKKYSFFFSAQAKFLLSLFLCIHIFIPTHSASAINILGYISQSVAYVENRYHINNESMKEQGDLFNVSYQKGQAPRVLLYFNPTDPEPGKKIKAHAFPEFFGGETDTFYYTWYLKRKKCDLCEKCTSPEERERLQHCDHDGDAKITVEDWKIEAAQLIASNGFDSTCSMNNTYTEEEKKKCKTDMYDPKADSLIEPGKKKETERDHDGYIAKFGGDGGYIDSPSKCTLSSSRDSISKEIDRDLKKYGDDVLGEMIWNVYDRTFENDTKNWSGRNWYIADQDEDDDQEIIYNPVEIPDGENDTDELTLSNDALVREPIPGKTYTIYIRRVEDFNESEPAILSVAFGGLTIGEILGNARDITLTAVPINSNPLTFTPDARWRGFIGEGDISEDDVSIKTYDSAQRSFPCRVCYIHDFNDGYNYELPECKHLFPKTKGNAIGESDGTFLINEESFWKTNPEDPSTAHNGNKDEANLAGLGQDIFTWTYDVGDKVGVAVEGPSMYTTKHDNSSPMIMWALPKNNCEVGGKGSYYEIVKGKYWNNGPGKPYGTEIKTATVDINECLANNLVDPTEGGQPENIELSLSSAPENPGAKLIEGDVSKNADILTIYSALENAVKNSSAVSYTWRVQVSEDGTFNTRFSDENTWVDVTDTLETSKNISTTKGNNVSSLSLDLNLNKAEFEDYFKDDIAYFRFSVNATSNFANSLTQSGMNSIIVKVTVNKSINVYDVALTGDTEKSLKLDKQKSFCHDDGDSESDTDQFQQIICPVLNNQIVGVELADSGNMRDFQWTLNDQMLTCTEQVSAEECSNNKQGAVNFFPVSGSVGDLYVLSATANDAKTGKTFTVTRRFQIVDPTFDFTVFDEDLKDSGQVVFPKYLGKYLNLDGTETSDFSTTSFEAIPGAIAKITATFRPEILKSFIMDKGVGGEAVDQNQNSIMWSINGKPFKANDEKISVPIDGNPGDIYTISLSGSYSQPLELRKALYDIWKISPFTTETLRFSKDLTVRIFAEGGGEDENARGKKTTFFASIISAVPPIVIFSVRLALSVLLILVIVGIAFSRIPKSENEA